MSDERSDLQFTVADEHGLPTRDYVGLLFPTDRRRWSDSYGSSALRMLVPPPAAQHEPGRSTTPGAAAVPSADSVARRSELMRGVPAGEYFAVAVDDADADGLRDPAFLDQLSRVGTRITLTNGVAAEIQLRRINLKPPSLR